MQNLSNAPSQTPVLASQDASQLPEQDNALALALKVIQAADDRKGADITLLHVTKVSLLADYFVIVTGFSKVQARAIANFIVDQVEEDLQQTPQHMEGQNDGNWVLLDYGDVIVHIMMPQDREFYGLEAFWGHAERVHYQSLLSE